MSLYISKLAIGADELVALDVQDGETYPDLDSSGQPVKPAEDAVLFDVNKGDVWSNTYHPAACAGFTSLIVSISGFTSGDDASGYTLGLNLNDIDCNNWSYKYHHLNANYDGNTGTMIWTVSFELASFPLATVKKLEIRTDRVRASGTQSESVDYKWTTPLELYLLPKFLPSYFAPDENSSKRLSLLLLRMFAGAAQQQGVSNDQQWVSLVVKICHGSALPMTGDVSKTEDHWLKYDAVNGQTSFVRPNSEKVSAFNNYGGDFLLSAWLWAFRIWRAKGVITLVNCFDQAGAVEIALTLGLHPEKVAWEHHKPYGFINERNGATLVGWGSCNNPYFRQQAQKGVMIVDRDDPKRTFFANHSYLVWNPDGTHPDFYEDWEKPVTPPISENSKSFAIDACAGPHLGDQVRGVWTEPWEIKPADANTYSGMRATDHAPSSSKEWWTRALGDDHHRCTPGIVRLANDKTATDVYLPVQDPLRDLWDKIAPPYNSPYTPDTQSKDIALDVLSDFEGNFARYIGESQAWESVPIADVPVNEGAVCMEAKVYEPGDVRIHYYSVRITTFGTYKTARYYSMACASFGVITSTAQAEGATKKEISMAKGATTIKTYMIQINSQCILCYKNLVAEVNGTVDKDKVRSLAEKVALKIMESDQ